MICLCASAVPKEIDEAVARSAQRADDLRRWEEYLAGLSGPEPPFAI